MSYPRDSLRDIQRRVHELSVAKGWWENVKHTKKRGFELTVDQILSRIALIHSEASEALEDARVGKMVTTGGLRYATGEDDSRAVSAIKPEGFPTELADIVIRVMDLAQGMDIDLHREIELKHAYNTTRAHRHGGKRA